jgi:AcrR family transcriptional regulator
MDLKGEVLAFPRLGMPEHHTMRTRQPRKRTRFSRQERRAKIIDAAARLIVRQGFLPLALEKLGRAALVSKALVYNYFPTQYDLYNAVLERELAALEAAGFDAASRDEVLREAVLKCMTIYFDHVATSGPLLHILWSDLYMLGHVVPTLASWREMRIQRLARLARSQLRLRGRESHAFIEMLITIPEEAGRLAFHGDIEPAIARDLCQAFTMSSLRGLERQD